MRELSIRLRFGPYRAPRYKYGSVVMDELRGEVALVETSSAKIPRPIGKRGRAKTLVLYKDLARAVRRESNQAVAYWWGVTPQTVTKWRKALGVAPGRRPLVCLGRPRKTNCSTSYQPAMSQNVRVER